MIVLIKEIRDIKDYLFIFSIGFIAMFMAIGIFTIVQFTSILLFPNTIWWVK